MSAQQLTELIRDGYEIPLASYVVLNELLTSHPGIKIQLTSRRARVTGQYILFIEILVPRKNRLAYFATDKILHAFPGYAVDRRYSDVLVYTLVPTTRRPMKAR